MCNGNVLGPAGNKDRVSDLMRLTFHWRKTDENESINQATGKIPIMIRT